MIYPGTQLQYPANPLPGADPSVDAFARMRVSNPTVLHDSKNVFDSGEGIIWDSATAGAGAVTYQAQSSSTRLNAPAVGDSVVRQTRRYFNYQPGKSQLIVCTGSFEAFEGTKRIGYFDAQNGVFLEVTRNGWFWVRRSDASGAVVDERVAQADWSDNTFSNLDVTKAQIIAIDMEWLGVGQIRCGFYQEGVLTYAHRFKHANVIDTVWARCPCLPVRYEVAGPGVVTQICSSVASEGGSDQFGIRRGALRAADVTIGVGDPAQVIAIRLKPAYTRATVFPTTVSVSAVTGQGIVWYVVLNPAFGAGNPATWVDIAGSAMQYDITRDGIWDGSGYVIANGVVSRDVEQGGADLSNYLTLGATIAGVRDELAVIAAPIAGNDDFIGAINWLEIL